MSKSPATKDLRNPYKINNLSAKDERFEYPFTIIRTVLQLKVLMS